MSRYRVLFIHANNSLSLFKDQVIKNNESLDESNDYLTDAIYLEIKNRKDFEVYDCPPMLHMYADSITDVSNITGLGFTLRKKLKGNPNTLSIEDTIYKIKERYFDLVFTDSRTMNKWWSDRKLSPFYEDAILLRSKILEYYPKNKIVFLDGEDQSESIQSEFYGKSIYFKRELVIDDDNLNAIGYCFPHQYFRRVSIEEKIKSIGHVIPGLKNTYIFNNENEFYEDYKKSFFGLTWKKLGWDCFRHHEIIFSSCLPLFPDIAECPNNTLTKYPKSICKRILKMDGLENIRYDRYQLAPGLYCYNVSEINIDNININQYQEILDEILEFSFNNHSSKRMLDYILKYVQL
jgi:hypothetical protein